MPAHSPSLPLCHLQVLTHLKHPSPLFFKIVLQHADDRLFAARALIPWLPGTAFLEYLARARVIQTTVVWHTPVKREAEHRLRGLNGRSLLLGQSYMKDKKNPLAKDIQWYSGNTTMQYSTQNSTKCRIFYATANQPKLRQDNKSKNREKKLGSKASQTFLLVSLA